MGQFVSRPSSHSPPCLQPPKKIQVLGRGRGSGAGLIFTPPPLRGGRTLDRGDSEAVPVPLPGSPTSEPQADPRAGGRVHGGHRRHQEDSAEGHRTAGEAPGPPGSAHWWAGLTLTPAPPPNVLPLLSAENKSHHPSTYIHP